MPTENQSQDIVKQFAAVDDASAASVSNVLSKQALEIINYERENQRRARARQQREKGRERLKQRHAGAISKVLTVSLNERAVGSTFERFFAALEDDLFTIVRIGNIELSNQDHAVLLDATEKQLEACAQFFRAELSNAELLLQNHKDEIDDLNYTEPATGVEIQVRTRNADKTIDIFRLFDSLLTELRKLEWAQVIEPNQLSETERKGKDQIFALRRFLARQAIRVRNRESINADQLKEEGAIPPSEVEVNS